MLYVSVVPADDDSVASAGSQMSALLPAELTQHLDSYDGSLGRRFARSFCVSHWSIVQLAHSSDWLMRTVLHMQTISVSYFHIGLVS